MIGKILTTITTCIFIIILFSCVYGALFTLDKSVQTHCQITNCSMNNSINNDVFSITIWYKYKNNATSYSFNDLKKTKFEELKKKINNHLNGKKFRCCANTDDIFQKICPKNIVWISVLTPLTTICFICVILLLIYCCLSNTKN